MCTLLFSSGELSENSSNTGTVLSTRLSSFSAKTASAINTLSFNHLKGDSASFVTYQPLDGAETKGLDSVYQDVSVCFGLAYFSKVKAKGSLRGRISTLFYKMTVNRM